jgi:heme a synthase
MQESIRIKIIGKWLMIGVAMLVVQILLGGITRLTGSGLSITEWKPILGTLPPLNEQEWLLAFEKYKSTGQFVFLNNDFTLSNFKFIFFWEWFHRNWAKCMAVVFMLPLIYFFIKKIILPKDLLPLILVFLIAAAQGLIGWIMVASGLNPDSLYVSHIKLALHFMSALVLISMVYWLALSYAKTDIRFGNSAIFYTGIGILILLAVQLTFGAYMAGLKAATASSTWPTINGVYLPETVGTKSWISNPLNVHFVHRNLAYLLSILILIWAVLTGKKNANKQLLAAKKTSLLIVIVQVLLGIGSILWSTKHVKNGMGLFEWTAQMHQLVAILLLLSIIRVIYMAKPSRYQ